MVYTVTFNPSLDYIISLQEFQMGLTNRTREEQMLPGGKGINVSTVLQNLGIENTALGFTAGFTGQEIERMISEIGFQCDFIRTRTGFSRINIKLKDYDGTEINGMGPVIQEEEAENLMEKLRGLQEGDVLVLAGSIPESLPDSIYRDILAELQGKGILFVVDATKDLLLFWSHKQGKQVSLKEYVEAMAEGQEKIYYVPGENKERLAKLPQVEALSKKGYDCLLFTEDVDEFIPQTLVNYMEKAFCNAASEDLGLQTEEEKKEAEEKAETLKGFLTFVQETLGEQVKEVRLSSNLGSHPVCMSPEAGMSFEMEKYMKRMTPEYNFSVGRILELNAEHEAVQAMQRAMTEDPLKAKDYAQLLMYQAQLMAQLPLEDPYAYTELVCKLMK